MTDDDGRAAEWLEDAPTFVESGAVPELAEDAEVTTPRRTLCDDCLSPAAPGGAMPTTPVDMARVTASEACLRGERWSWCRRGRLSLWFR